MKVTPKESAVCDSCNTRDSFIYFGGPGGLRRECVVCKNEQVGIDVIVNSHQSDDPPESEMEICGGCGYRGTKPCTFCAIVNSHQSDDPPADGNCSRCGCLLTWKYNPDGVKLCGDCNRRDEEYRDDMLRDAIGEDAFDEVLKQSKANLVAPEFVAKRVSDYPKEVEARYRCDTQNHDVECECSKCDALRRDEVDKMYDFESDLEDCKVECKELFADAVTL